MMDALKAHLASLGWKNIFVDFLPDSKDTPECVALMLWNHTVETISDGGGIYYVQIQVRRKQAQDAYKRCKALFLSLNSGIDEDIFELPGAGPCVLRHRRGPTILARDATTTTYYCEIALYGDI